MSRKPQIKLSYPDASELAMMLTDAMIRRAPGKRVVETTSEDKSNTDEGGSLLDGLDSVRTSTGVEMTLTLDPNSMDYALQQLIRPNLTEEERKRIFHEESSAGGNDIFSAQAAEAPGQALDGSSSPDVPSAEREAATQSGEQEKQIEVGKFSEKALRDILSEMIGTMEKGHGTFDAVNHAVYEIKKLAKGARRKLVSNGEKSIEEDPGLVDLLAVLICGAQRVQPKKTTALRLFANNLVQYLREAIDDEAVYVVTASELESTILATQQILTEHPGKELAAALDDLGKKRAMSDPSWDDVEKEARKIGQDKADKTDKSDKTDKAEAEQDEEIEPGLLNDIEDGEVGEK